MVLKATVTQYNKLNGYTKGVSKLEFNKDGNNNWIIGKYILDEPDFEEIKPELLKLKQIEYVEPIIEIIE
jgi:hypothetical protein